MTTVTTSATTFDTIVIHKGENWSEALRKIGHSRNDIFLVNGEVEDAKATGRALQSMALADDKLGLVAAVTLKMFDNFGGPSECVYSHGRRILSPLGLTAERANLRWAKVHVQPAGNDHDLVTTQSVWGSAVFIKRELLEKIDGFDAGYLKGGKLAVPNILIDDLCLQAMLAGYRSACTGRVVARVTDKDVTYPLEMNDTFLLWENKWGWNPFVPNVYHLRQRWNGTVLGRPMIEDLLDTWDGEEPSVDAIMLTGNALGKLKTCLASMAKTEYSRLRFNILLNGSGAPIRQYLSKLIADGFPFPLNVLACPVNVGVPAGLNWLMTQCKAPVVARLDDDIEMPPNWLREMVGTLRHYPLAGAVLPNAKVNLRQGGFALVSPMRLFPSMCSSEPAEKMPSFPYQSVHLTNFMGGAAVVFRKKAMDLAGTYDLRFSPTQNEDIDYGMALREAGYDLIVNGRVMMMHHTTGLQAGAHDSYLSSLSQRKFFMAKWGRSPAVLEVALDRDGRVVEP
jgi:GT2 family glycosyltransferase